MAKTLAVELVTPAGKAFDDHAVAVQLPGSEGSFQVLYNHAPILAMLGQGVVKLDLEGGEVKRFTIGGGMVEVSQNRVSILAESYSE